MYLPVAQLDSASNSDFEGSKQKQLSTVFAKRNRPKQRVEGVSVSSDAQRLCDDGERRFESIGFENKSISARGTAG